MKAVRAVLALHAPLMRSLLVPFAAWMGAANRADGVSSPARMLGRQIEPSKRPRRAGRAGIGARVVAEEAKEIDHVMAVRPPDLNRACMIE